VDRQLVIRAQEGDHDAFSRIAASSIGRLTAVARLILHDEYRAQDAVQDALVDAWRDIRGLRDPDRIDAWLHRLLVRSCYGQAKRAWRRDRVEVPLTPAHEPPLAEPHGVLESRDQLERALRRLSEDQRAVLVLTYFVDLPLAEAAETLGIPLGTMKSRLNRSMAALRAALEADARVVDADHAMEPSA
jgi:RNA polymerase sigma-70 factor (ECF subfamily)